MNIKDFFIIAPEVQEAIQKNKPVVALESTVIAHGLPKPKNIEVALKMEQIIRENGAIPATIAILNGKVKVGLTKNEFQLLNDPKIAKVSIRDISLLIAEHGSGATTVAGTMWAAHQAGIQFFVTGGIGGVHPGDGMDFSGDLPALSTIPVAVICSGPKSILDLPRTREWFETWGIPALGYKTNVLPAFYTAKTNIPIDRQVNTIEEMANYVQAHLMLKRSGILITVPVPSDKEVSAQEFHNWHHQCEEIAAKQKISGSALTPFMLGYLRELSKDATLMANLALLENNALIGAKIAYAYWTKLGKESNV
ncbi:MAG TPA: pseudouridine-5'-phosphate glycosidase [Planctomycetota bacterium]|jgi:pseudouridine-5'-phosphate glycosidase|nr:pseudouridine-5'-phosphate glycosidase [Planctomycetota bacterium]